MSDCRTAQSHTFYSSKLRGIANIHMEWCKSTDQKKKAARKFAQLLTNDHRFDSEVDLQEIDEGKMMMKNFMIVLMEVEKIIVV